MKSIIEIAEVVLVAEAASITLGDDSSLVNANEEDEKGIGHSLV